MTNANENKTCFVVCWLIAAVLGLVVFFLTKGAYSIGIALLFGILIGILAGLLLNVVFCEGSKASASQDNAGQDAAGSAAGASAASSAATASAAHDAAAEPVSTQASSSADTSGASASVAAAAVAGGAAVTAFAIKPSTPLSGEAELKDKKGEWKYAAPAVEAAPAKKAAKPAAKKAASKSADADAKPAAAKKSTAKAAKTAESTGAGSKPAALKKARAGGADDLKKIKGVGPKLEALLNKLGFFHFDQVAGWSADEIAWVDQNLEGFKGRVSRDNWVDQAKTLAAGGETEFSKRVDKGGVY